MESYCNAFRFLQLNEPAAIADRPGRRLQDLHHPQAGLSVGPNPLAGFEAMHVVLKFHTETLDRKSTRLNSSHLGISYAVFCLIKKIQNLTVRHPAWWLTDKAPSGTCHIST